MQCLEKPKDLAARVGVPVSAIRYLIRSRKLDHIYTTPSRRNPLVPEGAWERYVASSIVKARPEDPDDPSLLSPSRSNGE